MKVHLSMPTNECHGNIMWRGRYPMRGGRFPKDHPCAINPGGLQRFREALECWASCFPEGDGIVFDAKGSRAEVEVAIREHLGFVIA